jgi:hypothetical protein
MPPRFIAQLKRMAEVIVAVGILMTFIGGIITIFGGSIPPWATPKQVDNLSLKEDVDQQNIYRLLYHSYQDQERQAEIDLRKDPTSASALSQRDNALWQMRDIEKKLDAAPGRGGAAS